MGKVIALANQKGGVGKTTSTIELATNLTMLGKKVLVIDFDQQGDTTRIVNGDGNFKNIYQVINIDVPIAESIQHLEYFDLICSSKQLNKVDKTFTDRDDIYLLDEVLKPIKDSYDFILTDNNPDLGMLFTMSIVAADFVIIPTECDDNAINGLRETENVIEKLKHGRNHETHAEILGYILTKREDTNMYALAHEDIEKIASSKENKPFVMSISKGVKIAEAKTLRVPVSFEQKSSKQAREYYAIAQEIVTRTA